MNTIFAHCSGVGKSGVAVYRISGPSSIIALEKLINSSADKMQARSMYFRKICNPVTGEQIDEAMVVYFKGSSSFTGEDSVEIHVHGSIAVIKLLNEALLGIDDLRLAEAGEFARRAFLNGKFDLTAAEGLADLIDAETSAQHKQAIRQLGGGLEELYGNWRGALLRVMSLLEAYIDFPDEDIPREVLDNTKNNIDNLCHEIKVHLADNNRGERLRSGLKLAIIGKPNVGKSSLMNYLLKREAAIVSKIAGTTRDVIEGHLDIGGYPIILQDTAGIRDDAGDEIEQIGIEKAKEIMLGADIKIIMYDGGIREQGDDPFASSIDENSIIVFNKMDLSDRHPEEAIVVKNKDGGILSLAKDPGLKGEVLGAKAPHFDVLYSAFSTGPLASREPLHISIKTGKNLDKLTECIRQVAEKLANPSDNPQITRARHRAQLSKALESLQAFDIENDLVLAAEDIRMTIRYLSNITGVITVDEILGEIFSNFCIGK